MDKLDQLVLELCKLPKEKSWVEFKHNNYDPDMIGEDISALANSAALEDRDCAYMIWGIKNDSHEIVGTKFDGQSELVGNQEIENWLRSLLSSNTDFKFQKIKIDEKDIVVLTIGKATSQTSSFKKVEYIRVGSYTKKLSDVPSMKIRLWDKLRSNKFELDSAKRDLTLEIAISMLDYGKYFELTKKEVPSDFQNIVHYLIEDGIVKRQDNGLYSITNLGAVLFAQDINVFSTISRKAIRIVKYNGKNKACDTQEYISKRGYAIDFENILDVIKVFIAEKQRIEGALRVEKAVYPSIAIREILANALVHQDFSISGTGPVVEIFDDRIEVTNPGTILVKIDRIIDNPPKSRNEALASLMRRMYICEELGTGWDKIVISCEALYLSAPKILEYEDSTKVIMHSMIPYGEILLEDKIRSCYLHACIKWVQGEKMTNSSLRERFRVDPKNMSSISRLIKASIEKGKVKQFDPKNNSPKNMSYVPFWA